MLWGYPHGLGHPLCGEGFPVHSPLSIFIGLFQDFILFSGEPSRELIIVEHGLYLSCILV